MAKKTFVTSESVTEGHPDKVCDKISDAILDCLIGQDPMSRVAVECLATTGTIIVAGEVTTKGYANVQDIARETLKEIGYIDPEFGIDHEDAGVLVAIHRQSPDIAMGVNEGDGSHKEQGAGDQGMMYGFACDETKELMPLPIMLAHRLTRRLAEVRRKGTIKGIGPDGKSQVSVEYHDGVPKRIDAVVISTQHLESKSITRLRQEIRKHVIEPICKKYLDKKTTLPHQPHRAVRHRRTGGRHRPHRAQDHRRHLRRRGTSRRRRLLRQGPVQGGPLGGLRRALGGEEHRRRRAGHAAARSS